MQDVTKDREKYIGGSDIPVIMGLSPFKTRFELLQEKAQIIEHSFSGNEYTEYGNIMEPKIRDYINSLYSIMAVEDKVIDGDLRYHADGYDVSDNIVLEIKTTSEIHHDLWNYKRYLVQLALGMHLKKRADGILAVYERPEDFNEEFDATKLHIYNVVYQDVESLIEQEIYPAIDLFRNDLARLKENPELTEEELIPAEIVLMADLALELENELTRYKEAEQRAKSVKQSLKEAMEKYNIKTWVMNNGTKVTLVPGSEDSIVKAFDEKTFAAENKDIYQEYLIDKVKKGRAGYVRITPQKG